VLGVPIFPLSAILILKDEVLLTVGCPMVPPFYIDRQISVHRKFKKIDQLIFRKAKEIHFNEKCPIL
jgi:ribosomal protein L21